MSSLRPHQNELKQLGELAGVYMDSQLFSLLVELLNIGIDANTIYNLLKTIKRSTYQKSKLSLAYSSKSKQL